MECSYQQKSQCDLRDRTRTKKEKEAERNEEEHEERIVSGRDGAECQSHRKVVLHRTRKRKLRMATKRTKMMSIAVIQLFSQVTGVVHIKKGRGLNRVLPFPLLCLRIFSCALFSSLLIRIDELSWKRTDEHHLDWNRYEETQYAKGADTMFALNRDEPLQCPHCDAQQSHSDEEHAQIRNEEEDTRVRREKRRENQKGTEKREKEATEKEEERRWERRDREKRRSWMASLRCAIIRLEQTTCSDSEWGRRYWKRKETMAEAGEGGTEKETWPPREKGREREAMKQDAGNGREVGRAVRLRYNADPRAERRMKRENGTKIGRKKNRRRRPYATLQRICWYVEGGSTTKMSSRRKREECKTSTEDAGHDIQEQRNEQRTVTERHEEKRRTRRRRRAETEKSKNNRKKTERKRDRQSEQKGWGRRPKKKNTYLAKQHAGAPLASSEHHVLILLFFLSLLFAPLPPLSSWFVLFRNHSPFVSFFPIFLLFPFSSHLD